MTAPRQVEIFDTSLRDGLQQPNLEISVPAAVHLLERMGAFGIHYAEIGFAGANHFVTQLASALKNANTGAMKLALFGRTRGRNIQVADWPDLQLMLAHKDRISTAVIVAKSRLLDVQRSLETTPEENLLMVRETIAYLQDHGLEVIVDLEHAMDAFCSRQEFGQPSTPDFAAQTLSHFHALVDQCVSQSVSRIVICDTNGGASPEEVSAIFTDLTTRHTNAKFGFHGHTDRGLGVANTRAAILAGAVQVQGTLLGTGERCGNVNLTTVIGSMQLRGEAEFVPTASLTSLTSLAHSAFDAFALEVPHGAPIVGPGAFSTWAGMHGSSERKHPGAYLWCDPARVGATPAIGVNAHSGKANVLLLSEQLGVQLNNIQAQEFIEANTAMIDGGGFTASEVSFRLACMKILGTLPDLFAVRTWRVFDESDESGKRYVQASISLAINGVILTSRSEGEGPVDALTRAMRRELDKWYPDLQRMRLGRFSVTAIDVSALDSAARVRVTVSFTADGHDTHTTESWTTAGVSSDMNQAALNAILDGFHYWLLQTTVHAIEKQPVSTAI
ncbi:alpha-isopropylmalate synthase regulatory domain-containing protein [Terracidiphilus gabretensis]|uniref:alpha-isopropylmalate synthase regulatory domain-containing protein n=1 Tax=Terracidiphilus gabretensis TaxID=1577687 RepID=UPI00071BE46F|nr:alpha-isopropylmalate synthase regulatory domain-containing protein [Terracidiphilus gabretensis]